MPEIKRGVKTRVLRHVLGLWSPQGGTGATLATFICPVSLGMTGRGQGVDEVQMDKTKEAGEGCSQ